MSKLLVVKIKLGQLNLHVNLLFTVKFSELGKKKKRRKREHFRSFIFHWKFDTWKNKKQFRHFWPQLPYLDTEEQGGSIVHWLGRAVGARLLTESQVHSGKGRKSWNDLTRRDTNSSENLAPHPATLCMRSLRKKQKQQILSSAPTQTDRITQLCTLQPGFSVVCLKWQMFLMQIVRMWTFWKKKSTYCTVVTVFTLLMSTQGVLNSYLWVTHFQENVIWVLYGMSVSCFMYFLSSFKVFFM